MNKQKEILRAIGLNEGEVSMVVFDTAIDYLNRKTQQWATEISKTKSFWSWWLYQWQIIDDVFYASHKHEFSACDQDNLRYIWLDDHKAYQVNLGPHVWEEFHFNMMHNVTKEVVAQQ